MSFNALSIAKIGVGFGALAVASIGLISSTIKLVTYSGGFGYQYHKRTKSELEKERIRLGIIEPVAKKLTRVFRLASKKDSPLTEETFKSQAKLSGIEWKVEYGIYLALLRQIHNNAVNMAKERELYYALEAYELRRIEEADIVFVITMLASEIT